jgi:hypothetical protein
MATTKADFIKVTHYAGGSTEVSYYIRKDEIVAILEVIGSKPVRASIRLRGNGTSEESYFVTEKAAAIYEML